MKQYFLFVLLIFSTKLGAQDINSYKKQVELSIVSLNSRPLQIERDYMMDLDGTDITSFGSLGFSLGLRHLWLRKHFDWFIGADLGIYSFKTEINITEEFRALGWGGYSSRDVDYRIMYITPELGLKYALFNRNHGKLTVAGSLLASYHIRASGGSSTGASLGNGISVDLFDMEFTNNENNDIIIAPKVVLQYELALTETEAISIGFTGVFSSRTPFEGYYEIYGDNDVILTGRLKKQYMLVGMNICYSKKLSE